MNQSEDRLMRRVLYTAGVAACGTVISAVVYYTMFLVELKAATETMEKVTGNVQRDTARMVGDFKRNAEVARLEALNKDARDRQAKADAQHAEAAAKEAAINIAAAKEAAWDRYYKPSEKCQSYDARATMDCANEHVRAKREFDAKWAAGAITQ